MCLLIEWSAATRRPRTCYSYLGGIARSEPAWTSFGVVALSLVEILGEGGEKGIGQYDHFVIVKFAHVPIRQNDYILRLPAAGARKRRETHGPLGRILWTGDAVYGPPVLDVTGQQTPQPALLRRSCIGNAIDP